MELVRSAPVDREINVDGEGRGRRSLNSAEHFRVHKTLSHPLGALTTPKMRGTSDESDQATQPLPIKERVCSTLNLSDSRPPHCSHPSALHLSRAARLTAQMRGVWRPMAQEISQHRDEEL